MLRSNPSGYSASAQERVVLAVRLPVPGRTKAINLRGTESQVILVYLGLP